LKRENSSNKVERIIKNSELSVMIVVLLIIISIPIQNRIDRIRGNFSIIKQTLYLTSSSLKKLSLGYEQILSDIYWMRAIQYFGSSKVNFEDKDPDTLYKYFDIITDLDPKFVNAYRYGGTFLAEPFPAGLGMPELGIKLFDKGRNNNPSNFRLPLEEAFVYYLYLKDYDKAAKLFRESSNKPGLSDFRSASIRGMAATALNRGGKRDIAAQIWEYIYNTSENEGRRQYALQNLNELRAKDEEDKLTSVLKKYIKDKGTVPESMDELKESGYIKKIPKDYGGKDFIISKKLGVVRSSTLAKKELEENVRFYTAKAERYKKKYGHYPQKFNELKEFIINNSTFIEYRSNPMGEGYKYDPETGKVSYDKSFLEK